MFPGQDNTIKYNTKNNSNEIYSEGKSFLFDFLNGEFTLQDGKLSNAERLTALQLWINKILATDKGKYKIYDNTDYGIESLRELVISDYPFEFKKAEIERNIKEMLLKNKNIQAIDNFEFKRDKRLLTIRFNVISNLGLIVNEVSI